MPSTTSHEANRLYWETDESVAGIAQRLELSRRALYDAVQPLPAGRDCPDCGNMMVFENRSARTSDNALCLICTIEEEEAEQDELPAAPEPLPPPVDEDLVRVAGAALAGAAFGALATLLLVRRR